MPTNRHQILLGELLPSHALLLPILKEIKAKYGLDWQDTSDPLFAELLVKDSDIPWEMIKADIFDKVLNHPELWPTNLKSLADALRLETDNFQNPEQFVQNYVLTDKDIEATKKGLLNLLMPLLKKFDQMLKTTADFLVAYLATGESQVIPFDWLGNVQSSEMFGEPVVMAVAGRLSDPKEIAQKFTAEYHRVFGKNQPKISRGDLNAAKYLRMKLEGIRIKDIADIYIENHPSEFPKDPRSKEYRASKRKLEDRMKKNLQRLDKKITTLLGDNSDT